MEITEIRIKLMEGSEDRLRAFCSITVDDAFVVRDLKIIDGSNGPFVAMPSRKLTGHCRRCNHKNHLRAGYCNHCGGKLHADGDSGYDSPQKLYADVAHPINSECRELIQNAVITEFHAELNRCEQPGYRSRYDDEFGCEDVDATVAVEKDDSDSDDSTQPNTKSSAEPAERSNERPTATRSTATRSNDGDQVVPRPHFIDRPNAKVPQEEAKSVPREEAKSARRDEEDGFGAGVFSS